MDGYTNLAGMGEDEAKRYILAHATDLELLRKRIVEAEGEYKLWADRVNLAESRGLTDLQAQAAEQARQAGAKLDTLKTEAAALQRDVDFMKSQLGGLKARERSVDADLLLANMQMVNGEMEHPGRAELERGIKQSEADQALQALKASMGLGPAPNQEPAGKNPEATDGAQPDAEKPQGSDTGTGA